MQNKVFTYHPPEIENDVSVSFYFEKSAKIQSKCLDAKKKALLVIDSNLDSKKVSFVKRIVQEHIRNVDVYRFEYGPKNLKNVEKIWSALLESHPEVVIAFGGGTTCDLVGFAASCYQRGLDHIFFPTTLLSMVDACIGGKTGIDFGGIKNSIGQVHYARESHCFFEFLGSMETDELMSGVSEMVKAGMLFDSKLIDLMEKLPSKFVISKDWMSAISRSAQLKANISEEPFSERSRLLYGHNIGHGVETYNSTHRRHGDCVSIGMNYELAMAVAYKIVDPLVWKRQVDLLHKFGLPTVISGMSLEVIKERMKKYKLYKDGEFFFIVPQKFGKIYEQKHGYYWKLNERQFDTLFATAHAMNTQ